MRGSRGMLAVGLTVTMTLVCLSQDKPAARTSQSKSDLEFFSATGAQSASSQSSTERRSEARRPTSRWASDTSIPAGPIEYDAFRRAASQRAGAKTNVTAADRRINGSASRQPARVSSDSGVRRAAFEAQSSERSDQSDQWPAIRPAAHEEAPARAGSGVRHAVGQDRPAFSRSSSRLFDDGRQKIQPAAAVQPAEEDVFGPAGSQPEERKDPANLFAPLDATELQPVPSRERDTVDRAVFESGSAPTPVEPVAFEEAATEGGAPVLSLEWVRHEDFSVGQEATCELIVRNTGGSLAGNVIVEAYVPQFVQVLSTTPRTIDNGSLAWTLGELAPGDKQVVQLRVLPKQRGDMNLNAVVRFSGQTGASFSVEEPMLAVELQGPERVHIGESAPHVITVSNPGTGLARNVVIQASLPAGLEHRQGTRLVMQIGALNPGESREIRLALTAIESGNQPIQVEARAAGNLDEMVESAVNVVAPRLDLELKGPRVRYVGRTASYKLVVSNTGDVPNSNVRARYRLPRGFTFISADRGGRMNENDGTVEWFVGQLQVGETSEFTVKLRASELGTFAHQAGVISEHGASTTAQLESSIEGVASLAVTIMDRDDPIEVGQETMFEVRVANEGSRAAEQVRLTCDLPVGMELTSVRGPASYTNRGGAVVFEPLAAIPAGKTAVFQLVVRAKSGGSQRFRASLESDSIRDPLITEELTRVYND